MRAPLPDPFEGQIFRRYFREPWHFIATHWGVIIASFVLVAVDHWLNIRRFLVVSGTINEILFVTLPQVLVGGSKASLLWTIAALTFLIDGVFLVYFAHDLLLHFSNERVSAVDSVSHVTFGSMLRFFSIAITVYLTYGAVIYITFRVGRLLWQLGAAPAGWIVIVVIGALYPLFYACISLATYIAVLPISVKESAKASRAFISARGLVRTYMFFMVRSAVDGAAIVIITIILLYLENPIIQGFAISIALAVPLSFGRTSSFAFKMWMTSDHPFVRDLFSDYFRTHQAKISA